MSPFSRFCLPLSWLLLAACGCSGAAEANDSMTGTGGATATETTTASVGSNATASATSSGGAPTTGTSTSSGATSTTGTPELGPDGYPAECNPQVTPDASATQATHVEVALTFDGQPFMFGEYNTRLEGGTLLPTNLRFYLSHFAWLRGDELVPATLVDAEGTPLPYGVKLVNAEDEGTLNFDLRAPPGDYDRLAFLWGLSQGCNGSLRALDPPLDEASQLKWPHTLGFLFLRFEGTWDQAAPATLPTMIHMGAAEQPKGYAPQIRLDLPTESTSTLQLTVAVDAILDGAMADLDLSDFSPLFNGPEIIAGERLRRATPSLQIFQLMSEP